MLYQLQLRVGKNCKFMAQNNVKSFREYKRWVTETVKVMKRHYKDYANDPEAKVFVCVEGSILFMDGLSCV